MATNAEAAAAARPAEGSVELTALWVACKRALEAQRLLPLLHDAVTRAMVPVDVMDSLQVREWEAVEQARLAAAGGSGEGGGDPDAGADVQATVTLALRARYVDDELLGAVHALRRQRLAPGGSGGDGRIQVVLLGAGLDTRPWRLPLGADVAWWEVDLPDMAAFKRACMQRAGMQGDADGGGQPRSRAFPLHVASWAVLAADLTQPWWLEALAAAGWDAGQPTVWVVEGVTYYLSQAHCDGLVQAITRASLAAGRGAAILTSTNPSMIACMRLLRAGAGGRGAVPGARRWWFELTFPQYHATLGDDPAATLRQAGWQRSHSACTAELARAYGSRRSAQIVPAAAAAAAAASCSGAPPRYDIATATLGLG